MLLHLKFPLILLVEYSPFNIAALAFRHLIYMQKCRICFYLIFITIHSKYLMKWKIELRTRQSAFLRKFGNTCFIKSRDLNTSIAFPAVIKQNATTHLLQFCTEFTHNTYCFVSFLWEAWLRGGSSASQWIIIILSVLIFEMEWTCPNTEMELTLWRNISSNTCTDSLDFEVTLWRIINNK